MNHNVLVYGTLRPGKGREVKVKGQIFDLGSFPGVKLDKEGVFTAELVTVDDEILQNLDCYEGFREESPETSLYIRRRYTDVSQDVDAWIYEYNHKPGEIREVLGNDWLIHTGRPAGSAASFLGEPSYD